MAVDRHRIKELLERAKSVHLAVVGDCMLDVYLTGSVGRISPEAPVPVVKVEDERTAPGGAANVAVGVAALGASCDLVGIVGDDAAADALVAALEERNVVPDHLIRAPGRPTSTKTRVMVRHQHVVRYDRETDDEVPEDVADRILARIADVAESADALILQDYNKGVLTPSVIQRTIDLARRHDVPCVADPKFRNFFEYRGVRVFKPNAAELAAALGVARAPRDEEGLTRARTRLGCDHLLVTLAEEGMLLLDPAGALHRIRAAARDVYDVSGAGDTVTAVVATCLAAGASEYEAALIANYAAGVVVGKAGVVPVQSGEILTAVDDASRDSS